MQPFELDGSCVVCNGEIYGFRPLKRQLAEKGYQFRSGSDCEILLPLYREYGLDMFARLDAEFALILYDGEKDELIAARDPIGIRPLYYGYDSAGAIVFASEPKNLVGLCSRIQPFPPGCYYAGGQFVRYADLTAVEQYRADDLETVCRNIRQKLIAAVDKRAGCGRAAGLPALRRAGLLPGVRHQFRDPGEEDPHLRHRHGHGPHRPEVCPGGG